jgi:hypothetical protein
MQYFQDLTDLSLLKFLKIKNLLGISKNSRGARWDLLRNSLVWNMTLEYSYLTLYTYTVLFPLAGAHVRTASAYSSHSAILPLSR